MNRGLVSIDICNCRSLRQTEPCLSEVEGKNITLPLFKAHVLSFNYFDKKTNSARFWSVCGVKYQNNCLESNVKELI